MKKLRLRKWVKIVLLITFLMITFLILNDLDNDFIENCMNEGYSKEYCESKK